MSKTTLQREPHAIRGTDAAWWYEENKGITVVVEPHERTTQFVIPWKSLRAALARKDAP